MRVELDSRNEKLGYKIRDAQMQKVPYMLVVGAREEEAGRIAVRTRAGEDRGAQSVEDFVEHVQGVIAEKSNDL